MLSFFNKRNSHFRLVQLINAAALGIELSILGGSGPFSLVALLSSFPGLAENASLLRRALFLSTNILALDITYLEMQDENSNASFLLQLARAHIYAINASSLIVNAFTQKNEVAAPAMN